MAEQHAAGPSEVDRRRLPDELAMHDDQAVMREPRDPRVRLPDAHVGSLRKHRRGHEPEPADPGQPLPIARRLHARPAQPLGAAAAPGRTHDVRTASSAAAAFNNGS